MQIYYVLAHLGLGNNVFYRPDQQRPSQQPPDDPRRLLEVPRAPPPARGAIRPRKHGTSASQGGRKRVFYGTRANPGRNRTEKTRHFARPGRLFPGREAVSGPKCGIWPERPRKNPPGVTAFFDCQPGPE